MHTCKEYKEGHKKFVDALSSGEAHRYVIITAYLLDSNTNYNDGDDQKFLIELLFNDNIGIGHHLPYINYVLKMIRSGQSISFNMRTLYTNVLSKLSHFYFGMSEMLFQHDLLYALQQLDDIRLIEEYFSLLNSKLKIDLVNFLTYYCPLIFNYSEKFKMYRVFS